VAPSNVTSSRRCSAGPRAPRASMLIGVALLASACAGAATGSPEAALAALADALEAHDAEAAYALMSRSYRARVPFDTFRALVAAEDEASLAAIAALREPEGPAEIEARIVVSENEEIVLRREDGAFRVETDVVDYYSQLTPRAALRSFVRAAEHERYDVILRLMPRRDREQFDEARVRALWAEQRERMDRIVGVLRGALDAPIEVLGQRATLRGPSAHATLVLEGDVWVVEDPE
jgi:hypothetical protein